MWESKKTSCAELQPGSALHSRPNDGGRCSAASTTTTGETTDWLDDWIMAILERNRGANDAPMGLRTKRAGAAQRRAQATRERDAALRELAGRYYRGLRPSAQARTIRMLTIHYARMGWRRDRALTAPPPYYADAPHELLWRAFAAGAALPVSEPRLRAILRRRRAETAPRLIA
jgi:hypothetical protein